jgi:hypothetical protein
MKVDGKGDNPAAAEPGGMAPKQRHPSHAHDQDKRDRELDAWMDRAIGARKPDPEPVVRKL